ncbi:uncharacterized protein [Spinacia oleracea]|uniref:Uncharacterized protein n=1 Tax=Spinacia oleracea TaxID=3562 RepID=A0ABM3RHQ8_SPIOL|nr:uncharacterized protein LOC130469723 [Spinacia oleracea]
MSKPLMQACTVADMSIEYDWCTFAHEWLMTKSSEFAEKFDKAGFVAGCGGCTLFLLIFYLDHLNRPPLSWNEFPRIGVWTTEHVFLARDLDKKETDDYGKLSSLDIAYGEPHPRLTRDKITPISQEDEDEDCEDTRLVNNIMKLITPYLERLEEKIDKLQTARDNTRPFGFPIHDQFHIHSPAHHFADDIQDLDLGLNQPFTSLEQLGSPRIINPTSQRTQTEQQEINKKMAAVDDMLHIDNHHQVSVTDVIGKVANESLQSVLAQRHEEYHANNENDPGNNKELNQDDLLTSKELNEDARDNDEELNEDARDNEEAAAGGGGPRRRRSLGHRTHIPSAAVFSGDFVSGTNQRVTGPVNDITAFVKRWKDLRDEANPGQVMITCDGRSATQRDCYGVLHTRARVSADYVRMASEMYMKKWAMDYEGKSRRIMLDPTFAVITP